MLPGYTNVVWIYAFCNLHASLGVVGEDRAEKLLMEAPVAVNIDANGIVTVPTPASGYDEHLKRLQQPEVDFIYPSLSSSDRLRRVGINVLLLWIASNTFMVATVLCVPALSTFKPTKDGGKGFLWVGIVTWSNSILLAVQYIGMVLYYITRSIDRWIWTKRKSRFGWPDLEKISK